MQAEASHELQQACSEPKSPKLQTCGSGNSSATVMRKGSQSPPEALSPWIQTEGSADLDLYEIGDEPSQKSEQAMFQVPGLHQGNDWNEPLPFVLDSWELDNASGLKQQQAQISADCYTPLQQANFHDPATMMGSHAVQLSWDDIPSSFPFPSSNVGDLQRDMSAGSDQPCLTDPWSDLAMLQRSLKQPDLTCQIAQQSALQPGRWPAAQLTSSHTSFPAALWDSHADDLAIAPANIPAALKPPAYMPPQDYQGAHFATPFGMDWPLVPAQESGMGTDMLMRTSQQFTATTAGPILRGRVITPDEYRMQAASRHGKF